MDPANRALDENILTIKIGGSYVINSQHGIRPPQAKFSPGVHASVSMSYMMWTLRNLTLPMTATDFAVSATAFAGLGAAEFNM
jgi:hypothetical protein